MVFSLFFVLQLHNMLSELHQNSVQIFPKWETAYIKHQFSNYLETMMKKF